MKRFLYVIRDKVAAESGPIFEAKNDGLALRQYSYLMANQKGASPGDFELRCLGTIDHETDAIEHYGLAPQVVVASLDTDKESTIEKWHNTPLPGTEKANG